MSTDIVSVYDTSGFDFRDEYQRVVAAKYVSQIAFILPLLKSPTEPRSLALEVSSYRGTYADWEAAKDFNPVNTTPGTSEALQITFNVVNGVNALNARWGALERQKERALAKLSQCAEAIMAETAQVVNMTHGSAAKAYQLAHSEDAMLYADYKTARGGFHAVFLTELGLAIYFDYPRGGLTTIYSNGAERVRSTHVVAGIYDEFSPDIEFKMSRLGVPSLRKTLAGWWYSFGDSLRNALASNLTAEVDQTMKLLKDTAKEAPVPLLEALDKKRIVDSVDALRAAKVISMTDDEREKFYRDLSIVNISSEMIGAEMESARSDWVKTIDSFAHALPGGAIASNSSVGKEFTPRTIGFGFGDQPPKKKKKRPIEANIGESSGTVV